MDKALQNSHISLEYLIHQSDEAIIVFDEQGALTLWNAAMERIFGLNRENLVGKSIFDINGVFHPDQDQPLINSALDGKVRFSSNRQATHPITGQTIFYQAKFVPMADGDGGAVFIIDQTEQIRFREGLLKSEQYQRIINYFTSSLLDKTSVDEILWDVSKNCISGLDFVDCVIYLFDEDGRKLVQRAATRNNRPENPNFLNSMAIPLGDGIVGSVALSGKGEIVNNVNQDPRYIEDASLHGSEITVPMVYDGKVIGVIDSEHPEIGFYQDRHLRILETIASLCASKVIQAMAQRRVRESEEQLQLALQGADLGLWDLDLKSGAITHNHRWAEMLGYRLDEIEGNVSIWDKLMHPEDKPAVMASLQAHLDGETEFYEHEYRMRTKSGDWKWVFDRGRITRADSTGKAVRMTGTHLDIDERKQAEALIRQSQANLNALIENTDDIIWSVDSEYRLLAYNESYVRWITHFSDQQPVKGISTLFPGLSEDVLKRWKSYYDQGMSGKSLQFELALNISDELRTFDCSLNPILTEYKEITGVTVFLRDVTKRKEAEDERRQLTDELLRSNAELKQFAYITSHNLRAPVVNLVSLLDLCEKDRLDSENKAILSKVESSVRQLNDTLDDLVQLVSEKNDTRQVIERMPFAEVLKQVRESIEGQVVGSQAEIHSDFSKAPEVYYPRAHLQSILLNFLTNAIKYRSPERTPIIRIFSELVNGQVRLTVSDNGIGIDLDKHGAKLFGLYQRFHSHIEGKGLGLYIVKSQLEALGGRVEVQSKPDEGTMFHVYFEHNPN